jgi:hypothetical protein
LYPFFRRKILQLYPQSINASSSISTIIYLFSGAGAVSHSDNFGRAASKAADATQRDVCRPHIHRRRDPKRSPRTRNLSL